jgi:hypothetical protein
MSGGETWTDPQGGDPCAGSARVTLSVIVKLVDHLLASVDELVDNLHEGCDGGDPRLVDLLKDLGSLMPFL